MTCLNLRRIARPGGWLPTILTAVLLTASACLSQDRFELEVPGQPDLHSKAVIDAAGLTITGPDGELILYVRDPARDTPDYAAYFWAAGRQHIRFPIAGRGAMYKSLDGIRWERSQMQVRPAGPVGGPVARIREPVYLDVLDHGSDDVVGWIDRDAVLNFWHGHGHEWHSIGRFPNNQLIPGAPLQLTERIGTELPTVFTISRTGQLLEIVDGTDIHPLSSAVPQRYLPRGHLAVGHDAANTFLLAVRRPGRFLRLRDDGVSSTANFGDVPPGSPIGIADDTTNSFFFVDRFGRLHGRNMGTWNVVHPSLATPAPDFQPNGIVSATLAPPVGGGLAIIHLAAVDRFGRLRIMFDDGIGNWQTNTVTDFSLAPGQPLALINAAGNLRIGFCTRVGQLVELRRMPGGTWTLNQIAEGFPPHAPLQFRTIEGRLHCFVIDDRGDLAIGQFDGTGWIFAFASRGAELAARLVDRRIVSNETGPPVTLTWKNSYRDPLYVEIHDLLQPGQPVVLDIPAGGSVSEAVQPDGGLTIEDTYEIPVPGAPPQVDVRTYQQPARPRHKIIVWKNSVVSTFRDRTKQKRLPDSERRDLVSLGIFILPVGGGIKDGDVVSVYEDARRANNAGAPEFRRE